MDHKTWWWFPGLVFFRGMGAYRGRLAAECAGGSYHRLLADPIGVVLETKESSPPGKKAIVKEEVGALTFPGYYTEERRAVNPA